MSDDKSHGDVASLKVQQVAETCPAFAQGCPFSNVKRGVSMPIDELRAKCPAFEKGCPFEGVTDVGAIERVLKSVPTSHTQDKERAAVLRDTLKQVHTAAAELKDDLGACPVFVTDAPRCPFKVVCTNLQPLVTALDLRSWGVLVEEAAAAAAADGGSDIHLAAQLKTGTADAHRAAESVQFVRHFLRGRIPKDIYLRFVVYLYHIYDALERAGRQCKQHELYAPLHYDELERVPSLKRDLQYYFGDEWAAKVEQLKDDECVRNYVQRIEHIAAKQPHLLSAHAYTRYLGDLSGGQVLRRVAVKTYNLDAATGDGVRFYDFEAMPTKADHKKFKQRYREALDTLPVTQKVADEIVQEANVAFELNTAMFRALDDVAGLAAPAAAAASSSSAAAPAAATSTSSGSKKAQCPFANAPAAGGAAAAPAAPKAAVGSTGTTKGECPFATAAAAVGGGKAAAPRDAGAAAKGCPFHAKKDAFLGGTAYHVGIGVVLLAAVAGVAYLLVK